MACRKEDEERFAIAKEKSIKMCKEGMSNNDIAEALGITAGCVSKYVKDLRKQMAEEKAIKLVESYQKHKDIYKVAEEFGMKYNTTREWLNRSNVKFEHKRKYPLELVDEIRRQYFEDIPISEIGKNVNLNADIVMNILRNHGITQEYFIEKGVQRRLIAVVQLDMNGNYVNDYESIAEASRDNGIQADRIGYVCKSKAHCITAGGYKWMKLKDYLKTS